MKKILKPAFFNRSTPMVAEDLIGKFLVRESRGKRCAYMITETEAYDGFEDTASQAHRGKTKRNHVMFAEAGTIYVYLTYGMHCMLNLIAGPQEYPAGVLIRGVAEVSGPGRLTKALKITRALNTKKLGTATGLWVEDRGVVYTKKDIARTPRVGINCEETWRLAPYRFILVQ
ncbi:MAG: DNA-3-methyladenine glycosylase [Candidatus Paceibacterota bacterium]